MKLTPREYAFSPASLSPALGLPAGEWGLLLCDDGPDIHATLATQDVAYWMMLKAATPEARAGLMIPDGIFTRMRDGWPNEWEHAADGEAWVGA
jgi:hypothetical protein